jgi:hypothetical protein
MFFSGDEDHLLEQVLVEVCAISNVDTEDWRDSLSLEGA